MLERAQRDAEVARRGGDVPVGLLERAKDEVALERVARFLEQGFAGGGAESSLAKWYSRGRSSSVIQSLSLTATSRSMRFSSSRMLPGHQYDWQDLQGGIGDAAHRLAELAAVALEEQPRELREIVDALAQRRHADRNDVDAVVQVLAEAAVLDRLLEIDVGRRHQAEIGLDRLAAADALDLALLNRAQQLGLQVEAQVTNLVEEQGAAGGELELAELLFVRARERAALVAEQRALDQLVRDRRRG